MQTRLSIWLAPSRGLSKRATVLTMVRRNETGFNLMTCTCRVRFVWGTFPTCRLGSWHVRNVPHGRKLQPERTHKWPEYPC